MAYSPLGRGFLTGAYKDIKDFDPTDYRVECTAVCGMGKGEDRTEVINCPFLYAAIFRLDWAALPFPCFACSSWQLIHAAFAEHGTSGACSGARRQKGLHTWAARPGMGCITRQGSLVHLMRLCSLFQH